MSTRITPSLYRSALADIAAAGELYAINYGTTANAVEALDDLCAEGYGYVVNARDDLRVGGVEQKIVDAAFWRGYARGSV